MHNLFTQPYQFILDNKESVHIYNIHIIYIDLFGEYIPFLFVIWSYLSMVCAVYKMKYIPTPKQQNHNLIKLTFLYIFFWFNVWYGAVFIFLLWLEGNFNFNNLISFLFFFIYYRCIFDFFHSSCAFDVNSKICCVEYCRLFNTINILCVLLRHCLWNKIIKGSSLFLLIANFFFIPFFSSILCCWLCSWIITIK